MANVPHNDIDDGDTLVEFVGAGAPNDTGMHRYIILIFEHRDKLDVSGFERIRDCHKDGRFKTSTSKLIEDLQLDGPVFGNFYQAQYDDHVPKIHALLSAC